MLAARTRLRSLGDGLSRARLLVRATERSIRTGVAEHLCACCCLQLVGMFVFSTLQYDRFNLTSDFAAYSQAWTAIAHGHLNLDDQVLGLFLLAR